MEQPDNGYHWELLAKYLNNEITEQEKTELFAWVNQSPANREVFHQSTHLWHLTGTANQTKFEPNVEQSWQKFRSRLPEQKPVSSQTETKEVKLVPEAAPQTGVKVIQMYAWRVAATVLVFAGVAWLASLWLNNKAAEPIAFASSDAKRIVVLPDSSRVTLNKNSQLTFQPANEGNERQVTLRGEAFFEVKRDETKPFVILTENARTEVLGTSFTVQSDEQAGTTEVQVVTGRVALSKRITAERRDTSRIILTPGFKGIVRRESTPVKAKIDDPNFRAWQTGRLEYNDTPLDQVIASLRRYFGVTIEVDNETILNCRFTGAFDEPELRNVLDVLTVSMNLQYEYRDRQYTLSGTGCP